MTTGATGVAKDGREPEAEGSWEAEARDVQGIEKALEALRKQYASPAAAREGQAGTRNSVANLVVYAGSEDDAAQATAAVAQLAGRHPSRTILLIADLEPGAPEVHASVSAHCRLSGDGRRICYEEIRLRAAGRSGPHLRSIIDPLLISDLPVFLWWTGDPPFRDAVFQTLAAPCDRLLLDSGQFRAPTQTLTRLGQFIEDEAIGVRVGDLNWNRLTSWREILAQLFDPPATADLLPAIRRVRIERAGAPDGASASPAQSLLLAGWLAARLDWEPSTPGERTFGGADRLRLRSRGKDVLVELREEPHEGTSYGDVQSLHIQAEDGDHTATLTITRAADGEHAWTSVTIDGAVPQERSVRLTAPQDAALLGEEIDQLDPDRVFEESAEMAGRLAALVRPRGNGG